MLAEELHHIDSMVVSLEDSVSQNTTTTGRPNIEAQEQPANTVLEIFNSPQQLGQTQESQNGDQRTDIWDLDEDPPQKPPQDGSLVATLEPDHNTASKAEPAYDTELQALLTDLEPYRAHETSFFYFIEDPERAQQVIQKLEAGNVPYGIEFGPGESVSKLSEIDPNIPVWLAFEPDNAPFARSQKGTPLFERRGALSEKNKVVYVQQALTPENINTDIPGLQVVVYRNPDYREEVPFPDKEFREKKRVVLINDGMHIDEIDAYRAFLRGQGVQGDPLTFIEQKLNHSSWAKEESYLYDSRRLNEVTDNRTSEIKEPAIPLDHLKTVMQETIEQLATNANFSPSALTAAFTEYIRQHDSIPIDESLLQRQISDYLANFLQGEERISKRGVEGVYAIAERISSGEPLDDVVRSETEQAHNFREMEEQNRATITAILNSTIDEVNAQHNTSIAAITMGSLVSGNMTYRSDVDMVLTGNGAQDEILETALDELERRIKERFPHITLNGVYTPNTDGLPHVLYGGNETTFDIYGPNTDEVTGYIETNIPGFRKKSAAQSAESEQEKTDT